MSSKRYAYIRGHGPADEALDSGEAARELIRQAKAGGVESARGEELELKMGALAALERAWRGSEGVEAPPGEPNAAQIMDAMELLDRDIERECAVLKLSLRAPIEHMSAEEADGADSTLSMSQIEALLQDLDDLDDDLDDDDECVNVFESKLDSARQEEAETDRERSSKLCELSRWELGAWPRSPLLWGWFALAKNDALAWEKVLGRAEAVAGLDASILFAALNKEERAFAIAWEKSWGGAALASLVDMENVGKGLALAAWHAMPMLSEELCGRIGKADSCGARMQELGIGEEDTPLLCMVKGAAKRGAMREEAGGGQGEAEAMDEVSCARGLIRKSDARRGTLAAESFSPGKGEHEAQGLTTPLILAAKKGCVRIAQELLPASDERTMDNVGTALMHAALRGNAKMVAALANAQSATQCDRKMRRAISLACAEGMDECVAILAPLSDLVVGDINGDNALLAAVKARKWRSALLACSPDAAKRTDDQNKCALTILLDSLPARKGKETAEIGPLKKELLERLVELAGSQPPRLRRAPFVAAIKAGKLEAALILGSDLDWQKPILGEACAVELAIRAGGELAKHFLSDERSLPREGLDVGRLLAVSIEMAADDWAERLLSQGNPCEGMACAVDKQGSQERFTPLMMAAVNNRPDWVRRLATIETLQDSTEAGAKTAMMFAVESGSWEAVAALEEAEERLSLAPESRVNQALGAMSQLGKAIRFGDRGKIRHALLKKSIACAWGDMESASDAELAFGDLFTTPGSETRITEALRELGPVPIGLEKLTTNPIGFTMRNGFTLLDMFARVPSSPEAVELLLGKRGIDADIVAGSGPLIKACEHARHNNWEMQKRLILTWAQRISADIQDSGGQTALMRLFYSGQAMAGWSKTGAEPREVFGAMLEKSDLEIKDYAGRSIIEVAKRALREEDFLIFQEMWEAESERRSLDESVGASSARQPWRARVL